MSPFLTWQSFFPLGGFQSSINDGDADGVRGQSQGADPLANAAFASSYNIRAFS